MRIRAATDGDLANILAIHRAAFSDEPVADLTAALLCDPSTQPITSLLAWVDDTPVGHILFTAAHLQPETPHQISILAPLAVVPEWQRRGIGRSLITEGLALLALSGVSVVFVLGHPSYYPRFGFMPAGELGFAAPYPLSAKHQTAWMLRQLKGELPQSYVGRVRCAKTLEQPDYWPQSLEDEQLG
ncbi:MAG: N-acetyltransferase [Acaryochloridaceae cyanobacterium CSU_3_4]|nr:N-acetyltransferase [Acaryochloridaceae cyanobacterium CSU_3_4]